jgi:RNA-binding protein YlmH
MDAIMQHFRKDEQPFIEMALGWIREVENSYAPKLTDFLDPRERFILDSLIGGTDILVESYGAYPESERMRGLLFPSYYVPELTDFEVTVFRVKYATKFLTLEHKDVLGSLMSLGIDRAKFGDIQLAGDEVQFAVVSDLKDYMTANFISIGKAKVSVEEVETKEELIAAHDTWIESLQIVSSMRLDTVIASLLNFSRQKASVLIRSDRVRVNWATQNDPSAELYESDMLSIRGFGRFKIIAVEGRTKKDKVRLLTGHLE